MYKVTVDGEEFDWFEFHHALRDVLTRGLGKDWTWENITPKGK